MHASILTGIFILILASTIGETIVRTAQALRGRTDPRAGGPRDPDTTPEVMQTIARLEALVTEQAQTLAEQEDALARMQEQLDFTEKLLAARNPPP
jgi:hypothetical protein